MKKIVTSLLAFVMCLSMVCPVFAANFVPSITVKPAPGIVSTPDEEGNDVIGQITDKDGNVIGTEYADHIIITPVSSENASEQLKKLYDDFVAGNIKVSDIIPDGTWVIKDMFEISSNCDDLNKNLPGNKIDLVLDAGVAAGVAAKVMVYVDGQWKLLDNVVNNGDGTLTCTFEQLGPVSILVPGEEAGTPATGDINSTQIVMWTVIAGASLLAMVAVAVVYRRKMVK